MSLKQVRVGGRGFAGGEGARKEILPAKPAPFRPPKAALTVLICVKYSVKLWIKVCNLFKSLRNWNRPVTETTNLGN